MDQISHLGRRKIEAAIIGRFYTQLCRTHDEQTALQTVRRVLEEAATEEGRAFSATAQPRPGLGHFHTVLGLWDDALEIEPLEQSDTVLRFDVVRCRYVETYRELGLPAALVRLLSCGRDAPFARGYSDKIAFTRATTIAEGAPRCDFCYRWKS